IVPRELSSSPGRVADRFRQLCTRGFQRDDLKSLHELKESEQPTNLQVLKIDKLRQLDETPAEEWAFLARDVTFEVQDPNSRAGTGLDRPVLCPGDLAKLEKSLARFCVEFIRREQARSQHSERASSALFGARNLCAD